jgi:hypothetical protein
MAPNTANDANRMNVRISQPSSAGGHDAARYQARWITLWGDVNTCPARALPLRQSASARDSQTNRVEHGAAGAAVRRASSVGLQVHGSRGAYCG